MTLTYQALFIPGHLRSLIRLLIPQLDTENHLEARPFSLKNYRLCYKFKREKPMNHSVSM